MWVTVSSVSSTHPIDASAILVIIILLVPVSTDDIQPTHIISKSNTYILHSIVSFTDPHTL